MKLPLKRKYHQKGFLYQKDQIECNILLFDIIEVFIKEIALPYNFNIQHSKTQKQIAQNSVKYVKYLAIL